MQPHKLFPNSSFATVTRYLAGAKLRPNERIAADRLLGISDWSCKGDYRLRKPDAPAWHKLRDAWATEKGTVIRESAEPYMRAFCTEDAQVFLVDHNWAKVFENAAEFDRGEYPLPYDRCVFEFLIDDYRVLVLTEKTDAVPNYLIWIYDGWAWVGLDPVQEGEVGSLSAFMVAHIRAICIALDAEVAYADPIRAPAKLNAARIKRGKTPLPDYRVVKLVQNKVHMNALEPTEPGPKKRLHFRRGHWRHLGNFKTWVRWCLVGSPDLSFVDKFYRI